MCDLTNLRLIKRTRFQCEKRLKSSDKGASQSLNELIMLLSEKRHIMSKSNLSIAVHEKLEF